MTDVIVVGSLNMDIVVRVEKLPVTGETMHGLSLQKFPGGKGANQSTALARLGDSVALIGAVGNDEDGRALVTRLAENQVDTRHLDRLEGSPTGSAVIIVDQNGNNQIIVLRGANACVDVARVKRLESAIRAAKFLLMQFEIPMPTVEHLIDFAARNKIPVVINPSPYYPIAAEILRKIDFLVLNEIEAGFMTGAPITTLEQAKDAACAIFDKGVKHVILTLGDQGAILCHRSGEVEHIPPFKVDAVDTTGSGDAFLAGLLHGLLAEMPIREAVNFANAVGAITVTKLGAQSSLPYLAEVTQFIR